MSSNIKIVKICEYCQHEFIAKTTTTKCCSDNCSKRFYKLKIKNDKIAQTNLKTEIKRKPKNFITEEEIKVIQAKENLTLIEAAILLNVTPLTLRRWTLSDKIKANKVGKKWMFEKQSIIAFSTK